MCLSPHSLCSALCQNLENKRWKIPPFKFTIGGFCCCSLPEKDSVPSLSKKRFSGSMSRSRVQQEKISSKWRWAGGRVDGWMVMSLKFVCRVQFCGGALRKSCSKQGEKFHTLTLRCHFLLPNLRSLFMPTRP